MNDNLLNTLKQIIAMYGETVLSEPKRVSALLSDLAKDEPKPHKYALLKALEHGFVKILGNADEADRNECGQSLAQRLHEEEGLDLALCAGTLDLLAAALFGERSVPAPAAPKPSASIPAGFVKVAGGTFLMGSNSGKNNEKPVHRVTVKSFYMGKYQVTQKEWQDIMGTTPSQLQGNNLPVENVDWYEAVEYCNRRSIKEGLTPAYRGSGDSITCDWSANGYRLPTEAEWEFAAKGGGKDSLVYEYSGSNSAGSVAWYMDNSGNTTHPVGTKAPNSLGIYDMSGNVYEWCWDWYDYYPSGSQTDPRGASSGSSVSNRVHRGGGWFDSAVNVRSADRGNSRPYRYNGLIGFRIVRGI